jgi:hypothetical protein
VITPLRSPAHAPVRSPAAPPKPATLRPRALFVGALASIAVGLGAPYATLVLRGSYVDLDFSTPAAVFFFFVLVAIVQPLLRRWLPRASLSSAECLLVYTMMIVACALTTMGMTCQLLPTIAMPYYQGGSRTWAEQFGAELRPWLSPADPVVVERFFEGLRAGETIPWAAWARPLAIWSILLLALYGTSVCLMVILRRQWSDRERLAYPLAHLPLEMVRAEGGSGSAAPFLKQAWMWGGFLLPFTVGSTIGLHYYYPSFPQVETVWSVPAFRETQSLIMRISFPMIGFFFLVNTETLFSLWLFNLAAWTARGYMRILGVEWDENLGIYGSVHPAFKYLGMGAMAALVANGFRSAAPHLLQSWRSAVRGRKSVRPGVGVPTPQDVQEPMSYRAAWGGVIAGLAVMYVWLWVSGIAPLPLLFFMVGAFVLFIGLTRVVVEAGLAEAVPSTTSPGFTVAALGVGSVGKSSLPALGMTFIWGGDMRTFVMASTANGLKLGESLPPGRRHTLITAIFLAILLAGSTSIYLTLRMAYEQGGVNLNGWFFIDGPQAPWKWVADKRLNPTDASVPGWMLTLAGAGGMGFLALMRHHYLWWPFHPIGFAVGATWIMDQLWFSALIAWVCKLLVVRYGGREFFRRARLFFLGLILGQFTCNGMWLIIDAICGQRGNQIFWI